MTFTGGNMPTVDIDGVGNWTSEGGVLLDARAGERYRGEVEPMDPVAGHIPGAVNAPTAENITGDGRFLDTTHLRERFAGLGVGDKVAVYCGSGVTAAHEIAALAIAGYDADAVPGLVVTVVQRQHSRRRHRSLSQLLVRSMNDGTRNHSAVNMIAAHAAKTFAATPPTATSAINRTVPVMEAARKAMPSQGESVGHGQYVLAVPTAEKHAMPDRGCHQEPERDGNKDHRHQVDAADVRRRFLVAFGECHEEAGRQTGSAHQRARRAALATPR